VYRQHWTTPDTTLWPCRVVSRRLFNLIHTGLEERQLVELRVAVSRAVRALRERQNLTQTQVARKLKTSQPRIAKLESGASDVSLDLMFRGLFALGGTIKDLRIVR
jgi:predicted XRE-type DNA-binding protein